MRKKLSSNAFLFQSFIDPVSEFYWPLLPCFATSSSSLSSTQTRAPANSPLATSILSIPCIVSSELGRSLDVLLGHCWLRAPSPVLWALSCQHNGFEGFLVNLFNCLRQLSKFYFNVWHFELKITLTQGFWQNSDFTVNSQAVEMSQINQTEEGSQKMHISFVAIHFNSSSLSLEWVVFSYMQPVPSKERVLGGCIIKQEKKIGRNLHSQYSQVFCTRSTVLLQNT